MKKITYLSIGVFMAVLLLGWSLMFDVANNSKAQTSEPDWEKVRLEQEKLRERDNSIPTEKVEKAFAEAKKIQDDIVATMRVNTPNLILRRTSQGHLMAGNGLSFSTAPGRLGRTSNEITWKSRSTHVWIAVSLELRKDEMHSMFWKYLNSISMGDFFKVSDIGDEAILVKNFYSNRKATGVSLHFIKGRAQVVISVDNFRRKTEKNEKELMEIARLIEPLIIARPNFDD